MRDPWRFRNDPVLKLQCCYCSPLLCCVVDSRWSRGSSQKLLPISLTFCLHFDSRYAEGSSQILLSILLSSCLAGSSLGDSRLHLRRLELKKSFPFFKLSGWILARGRQLKRETEVLKRHDWLESNDSGSSFEANSRLKLLARVWASSGSSFDFLDLDFACFNSDLSHSNFHIIVEASRVNLKTYDGQDDEGSNKTANSASTLDDQEESRRKTSVINSRDKDQEKEASQKSVKNSDARTKQPKGQPSAKVDLKEAKEKQSTKDRATREEPPPLSKSPAQTDEDTFLGQFTDKVMAAVYPKGLDSRELQKYDGTQDPLTHLNNLKMEIMVRGIRGNVIPRLFPGTFRGAAQLWFHSLPHLSIPDMKTLEQKFLLNFTTSRRQPKNPRVERRGTPALHNSRLGRIIPAKEVDYQATPYNVG
ncbi:hypothetical protein K1719_002066 [Acacia pycnantha]|nr:hypothetical protein K1719_002066 [Acacia pycnantha]